MAAALTNPARVHKRLLTTSGARESLPALPIEAELVEREAIEAVLPESAVHQGVALLTAPLPRQTVDDLILTSGGTDTCVIIALDQVTDPQNIGAVLRSASAFGAAGVILPDRNAPDAGAALAKAASGALETVPLVRAPNLVRALESLKEHGFWVLGLDMDGAEDLPGANLPARCILVLGAEGRGLRRLTRETCDMMVRVPISGQIESLNVSASAAVSLYEWARTHRSD